MASAVPRPTRGCGRPPLGGDRLGLRGKLRSSRRDSVDGVPGRRDRVRPTQDWCGGMGASPVLARNAIWRAADGSTGRFALAPSKPKYRMRSLTRWLHPETRRRPRRASSRAAGVRAGRAPRRRTPSSVRGLQRQARGVKRREGVVIARIVDRLRELEGGAGATSGGTPLCAGVESRTHPMSKVGAMRPSFLCAAPWY